MKTWPDTYKKPNYKRGPHLRDNWFYKRGDIYLANLNPFIGSEQGGTRPVLVLQNNDGNLYSPVLIVAPITSKIKKLTQPTHYFLEKNKALSVPSMVEFEQLTRIDKSRVITYLGKLTEEQYERVDNYLINTLDIHIPESIDAP